MLSELKQKRDKEELLEKRRAKLKKLLEEEDNSYQIELLVKKNLRLNEQSSKTKADHIPTEVLKDVNCELKRKEEERRKREAELKLYHQWRNNNPIIRQFESKYKMKNLKLSWLDQQIEKRMQKESEERECKRLVQEQEERLKREQEQEEQVKKQLEEKQIRLKEDLERQIEELKEKQKRSQELKKKENEELEKQRQLEDLEATAREEESRRLAKENALYNIKQHKLKLKQRAFDVQEALLKDQEFILKMKRLELEKYLDNDKKRNDIKRGLLEFLAIVKDQQELEKHRQRHLEFLFDSEAKAVYDKQLQLWKNEECARKKLLKDVLDTINRQIQENIQQNQETQREILREREEVMLKVEQYDRELQELKEEEQRRKKQRKYIIDEDVKLKNARIKQEENRKLKEIDEELQRVRSEEERLHKEIMAIQRRQGPSRPTGRSRLFY